MTDSKPKERYGRSPHFDGGGSEDGGKVLDLRAGTTHVDGLKYLVGEDFKPMKAREHNRRVVEHALSGRRVTIFQPTNQQGNTMSASEERGPTDAEAHMDAPVPEAPVVKLGATRGEVRVAVDGERAYQDELTQTKATVGEEILLLQRYVHKATKAWALDFNPPEQDALAHVRKIAAIAQRCMENNGAPKREGY